MTIHIPERPQHEDNPLLLAAAWVGIAAVLAGIFYGITQLTTTTEPGDTADTESFCKGWVNGIAYAVYQVTGDEEFAIAYASGKVEGLTPDKVPPPCDTSLAVASDDPITAWCRGLGEGYIAASEGPLEIGSPSQGHDVWMDETLVTCAETGLYATPVVPDTGPQGGGPPPRDS